jgi:hypothetical protein
MEETTGTSNLQVVVSTTNTTAANQTQNHQQGHNSNSGSSNALNQSSGGIQSLLIPAANSSSSSLPLLNGSAIVNEPSFLRDFVLISEFSELEGPVPLVVMPEGGEGKFNINDFVLRIMAVDYQNKGNDLGMYIFLGCDLLTCLLASFSEDTQVVLSEDKESAFAYVSIIH